MFLNDNDSFFLVEEDENLLNEGFFSSGKEITPQQWNQIKTGVMKLVDKFYDAYKYALEQEIKRLKNDGGTISKLSMKAFERNLANLPARKEKDIKKNKGSLDKIDKKGKGKVYNYMNGSIDVKLFRTYMKGKLANDILNKESLFGYKVFVTLTNGIESGIEVVISVPSIKISNGSKNESFNILDMF